MDDLVKTGVASVSLDRLKAKSKRGQSFPENVHQVRRCNFHIKTLASATFIIVKVNLASLFILFSRTCLLFFCHTMPWTFDFNFMAMAEVNERNSSVLAPALLPLLGRQGHRLRRSWPFNYSLPLLLNTLPSLWPRTLMDPNNVAHTILGHKHLTTTQCRECCIMKCVILTYDWLVC